MQAFKSFNLAAILVAAFAANVNTLAGSNTRRSKKRNGRGAPGAYGRGLQNHFNAKRAAAMAQRPGLRDEHGAYTLTGFNGRLPTIVGYDKHDECVIEMRDVPRRKWIAGISAQRGY